jgi:hypothetical protein
MTEIRVDEAAINATLDACLHGARDGDVAQARRLHEMLDMMLTEREAPEGKLWLTDHGRMVLAEMHRQLSRCEGADADMRETVLKAVQLKPSTGPWNDTCSFLRDLRIATTVANELCEQRNAGSKPDLTLAAQTIADRGEFDLEPASICAVYDQIASTVVGFREISHC